MNFRLIQPTLLVDINRLTELDFIQTDQSGGIRIGALTRQRRLERDPLVSRHTPLLHEAIPHIAHLQIRNRGTIGGTLAHSDPAAELPVIMVTLDGRFRIRNLSGERWVRAGDFFQDLFVTDLAPDDILVEISIPAMERFTGWSFVEFARRKGDYALLGVAALITLDESGRCSRARLVYLNAGVCPVNALDAAQMLVGQKPNETLFSDVAEYAADQEIDPTADIHASVPYLRHLARVLTIQALKKATTRSSQSLERHVSESK